MQLLRDTLTLWTSDMQSEGGDADKAEGNNPYVSDPGFKQMLYLLNLKKNLLGLEGVWSLGWSDFEKEKAMLCQIVEGPQIQNFMS